LFFEFDKDFVSDDFLKQLLWGENHSTKEHPEEFFSRGKFLIILSFEKNSPIKKFSQQLILSKLTKNHSR